MIDFKKILQKYVLKKDRFSFFFIVNLLLGILVFMFLYIKLKAIVLTLIFSAIIFVIRWRRQVMGIHLTLEPVILFSIVLLRVAGIGYALAACFFSTLLADIVSGKLRSGTFISIFCKWGVIFAVSLIPGGNLILVTMVSYVIINEGIGTFLAMQAATPMDQIITQVMTSSVIRLVYLNLFLFPLIGLLS